MRGGIGPLGGPAALAAIALVAGLVVEPETSLGGVEQEAPQATFDDAPRIDSLRARVTPDRLEELRRQAAEGGDPRHWYDLGTALLLSGDWEGAIEPLERAVAATAAPQLEAAASYNLGVAQALGSRPAESALAGAGPTDVRRAGLLRARDVFRRVLREEPGAEDARWNLEVVGKWLDELGGGGGGDGGGEGGGDQSEAGDRGEMTPEEVQRLLEAAASEERRVQEERFERSRARDPVAERNW